MTTVIRVSSPGSGLIKLWDQASCKKTLGTRNYLSRSGVEEKLGGGGPQFFSVDYGGLERSKEGLGGSYFGVTFYGGS